MDTATHHLLQHGYLALFVVALAERAGVPLLITPFLIAAGVMAALGSMSLALVILVATAPAVGADIGWYWLGKHKGVAVLGFICRMSLEKDSCVRRTQAYTARHAGRSLIYSKFIPGVAHLAPPMAGLSGMEFPRFLLWETLGTLIWTVTLVLAGFIATVGVRWPDWPSLTAIALGYVPVTLAAALVGNVGWKYTRRRMFIRSLRADRIEPEVLKEKFGNADLVVIDLRHQLDVLYDPRSIPGALHIYPEDLKDRYHEIPADKDIVLYCT